MDNIKILSKKLEPLFTKIPVDAVYLYGSRSKGKDDGLSDYDFGILFSEILTEKKRFDLRLQLFGDIARTIKILEDNIDVVDIEEAPVLLQYNIISGELIYCKNKIRKINYEVYVMARYHDEHYYYDRYFQETLNKIEKGVYFERRISYA